MARPLESDLRHLFSQQASKTPIGPIAARLSRIDYHPRSQPTWRTIALACVVIGLAAAGSTVSIVGLGAGVQPAFAGWAASPTTPAAGQVAAAESACLTRVRSSADAPPAAAGVPSPVRESLSKIAPDAWRAVLVDTRGPYTAMILEAPNEGQASCFSGPTPASTFVGVGPASGESDVPTGQIDVTSSGSLRVVNGDVYSQADGRVGSGVTSVTIVLADGSRVTATSAGGRFLAWWPGSEAASKAEVAATTGTSTQNIANKAASALGSATHMRASSRFGSRLHCVGDHLVGEACIRRLTHTTTQSAGG